MPEAIDVTLIACLGLASLHITRVPVARPKQRNAPTTHAALAPNSHTLSSLQEALQQQDDSNTYPSLEEDHPAAFTGSRTRSPASNKHRLLGLRSMFLSACGILLWIPQRLQLFLTSAISSSRVHPHLPPLPTLQISSPQFLSGHRCFPTILDEAEANRRMWHPLASWIWTKVKTIDTGQGHLASHVVERNNMHNTPYANHLKRQKRSSSQKVRRMDVSRFHDLTCCRRHTRASNTCWRLAQPSSHYHLIRLGFGEFHILTLQPSTTFSADIAYTLMNISLESHPTYEVLSYAWGDKTAPLSESCLRAK